MYFDFNKENNKEVLKFSVVDNIRISKCKNIFAKGYAPKLEIGFKKFFYYKSQKYCFVDICYS